MKIAGLSRTVGQVEHKWWDLKSAAKQAVAKWKKETTKTGGGSNTAPTPTDTQFRIINIIGGQSVTGIDGASNLEVAISS